MIGQAAPLNALAAPQSAYTQVDHKSRSSGTPCPATLSGWMALVATQGRIGDAVKQLGISRTALLEATVEIKAMVLGNG
ncbi:hypothetical protein ACX3P0_17075 [Mesorhizobium sp. A556]